MTPADNATVPPLVLVGLTAVIFSVFPPPLSLANSLATLTLAEWFATAPRVSLPATGPLLTVTVNVQVATFEQPSVAVHVTVVAPNGKVEPEAGTHAAETDEQRSVA